MPQLSPMFWIVFPFFLLFVLLGVWVYLGSDYEKFVMTDFVFDLSDMMKEW